MAKNEKKRDLAEKVAVEEVKPVAVATDEIAVEPVVQMSEPEVNDDTNRSPVDDGLGFTAPVFEELPEDHPDRYKPLFKEEEYDITKTPADTLQEKVIAAQGVHYMKNDLLKVNEKRNTNSRLRYDEPWYGVYSVDHYSMRGHHIGEIIPEIAYLPNKNIPLRKEMLNLEWISRLVDAGCIVKDLTPGVWTGTINKNNIASYLRKVNWMLDNGKLRP